MSAAFSLSFDRFSFADWEPLLAGQRDHFVARRITFYHLLEGLFEKFKSIMTPYMATALDNVTESLEGFVAKAETDGRLWLQILVVLQKSFEYDEGSAFLPFLSLIFPALTD